MCINKRWIRNAYTHKYHLVKCGHCPACLVEKARHRACRIKNNVYSDQVSLFCTLTYANEFIPYIRVQDLRNKERYLTVFRDASVRRVRVGSDYVMRYRSTPDLQELDTFDMGEDFYNHQFDFKELRNKPDCIGVCYYKDIQNFFKRLDINLKRRYGFKGSYSRFACHEYGTRGNRPHFHVVLFCKPMDVQMFKSAINEAWPFDRGNVRHRKCELTKGSVANYVASYVNSFASFHPLLSSHNFRSKCSYSRGFGLAPQSFSLDQILSCATKGSLQWSFETLNQRIPTIVTVSIPKYVINRYFPKFKGYSRLASDQIYDILDNPYRIAAYKRILDLSRDDIHRIIVMLENAKKRYPSPISFADDYVMVWSVFSRQVLRNFYENLTFTQFDYDNIGILEKRPFLDRSLLPLFTDHSCDGLNPNRYPQNLIDEMLLNEEFSTRQKHKEINQLYFESQNFEQLI